MSAVIPETPAEITAGWLGEALASAGLTDTPAVSAVEQEVLGEGEGFLGDILRLHLSYADTAPGSLPRTMVAKLPKLANREMGELLGAYERENMFYMTMAQALPIRTPYMYFGDFDRDATSEKQEEILRATDKLPLWMTGLTTGVARWIVRRKGRRYILLLEDMPGTPGDQVNGADAARCDAVLQQLAPAHASFWAQPMTEHFWLLPLDIDARMRHGMFKASRPAFARTFGDLLEQGLDRFVERLTRAGHQPMLELCRAPATLLHCDMRLDNVFFDGEQVIIFDWQLVRRGPAAYDVAYFLSGALRRDEPDTVVEDLLAGYHGALQALGISDYPLERFQRDYALALLTNLQSLSNIDSMDMGDGRGTDLMQSWMRRLLARLEHAEKWM